MALRRKKVFHTFDQETAHVQSNKKNQKVLFYKSSYSQGHEQGDGHCFFMTDFSGQYFSQIDIVTIVTKMS